MQRLLLLFLMCFTSLSLLAENKDLYSVSNENTPAIGEALKRYLGDKMMVQRTGKYLPCYKFNISLTQRFVFGTSTQAIQKGALFCRDSAEMPYYISREPTNFMSGIEAKGTLDLQEGKKTSKVCVRGMHCFKKVSNEIFATQFEHGNFLIVADDSAQQSIEYSGRSGPILTFTYSEYTDKLARDAFTREFKVDLNDGKVAGFKGAVFEIVSADNMQIEYKVIKHFGPSRSL